MNSAEENENDDLQQEKSKNAKIDPTNDRLASEDEETSFGTGIFSAIKEIKAYRENDDKTIYIFTDVKEDKKRLTILERAQSTCYDLNLDAYVCLVNKKQWDSLNEKINYLDISKDRVKFRSFSLERLDEYRTLFEMLMNEDSMALDLYAEIAATTMQDLLRLLFAHANLSFNHNSDDRQSFADHFSAKHGMRLEHFDLLRHFESFALYAKQAVRKQQKLAQAKLDFIALLEKSLVFIRLFERYLWQEKATLKERRTYKLKRFGLPLGILATFVIGSIITYFAMKPVKPDYQTNKLRGARGWVPVTYYKDKDFKTKVVERDVRRISFRWHKDPEKDVPINNFSARYEGYLHFHTPGKHVLCFQGEGGARLYVKNKLLLNDWKKHKNERNCSSLRVKRGWYKFAVEYFNDKKSSFLQFLVGASKKKATIVPSSYFCCKKKKNASPIQKIKYKKSEEKRVENNKGKPALPARVPLKRIMPKKAPGKIPLKKKTPIPSKK